VRAFDALVRDGKVLHVAMSNTTPERLEESLTVAETEGWAPYEWLQPHYNLVEREGYERGFAPVVEAHGLAVAPYYALASGFLTGKYRGDGAGDSPRAERASGYLDERGRKVLDALDAVAAEHGVPVAAVAIAWLLAKPGVRSPIASARTPEQLADVLPGVTLQLTDAQITRLDEASA
jgi:aryl-alcohol dehydrogenase-like predicted oxidoreductase